MLYSVKCVNISDTINIKFKKKGNEKNYIIILLYVVLLFAKHFGGMHVLIFFSNFSLQVQYIGWYCKVSPADSKINVML